METICRLCFSVADKLSCELTQDSEIMLKLNSCLCLELNLMDSFPKQICDECYKKVIDVHKFCEKVLQNELKLVQHLNNNSLDSFYGSFTNEDGSEIMVKEEDESLHSSYNEPIELDTAPQITIEVPQIIDNENFGNKKKPKAKRKGPTAKRIKVDRKVICKDNYSDHDPNQCLTCSKLCDSSISLSKHYKKEHSIEPGSLMSDDHNTVDKYTLYKVDGKQLYKCNSCGDSNEDVKDIVKHVVLHMYERPFLCKLCGKTYKTVYEIVRHGKVHSGFKLFCQHGCGYTSPYPGAMRDHEKRHTDERNYTCKTCGKGFLVKTWFDQHQNIHNNLKPFICDFCGMAFHMHRYLVTHRNKRHPGLSAIRKYTCTQCSFTSDNKNGLTTHMEEHTDNPSEARLTLLCDLCGKGFARTDHLTNHKNGKHFGIKPYSCSVCNKQFQKKFNLTVHARIHTGEGRHLCLHCGKLFAQKSTLHRHQKKRHPEEYDAAKDDRPK